MLCTALWQLWQWEHQDTLPESVCMCVSPLVPVSACKGLAPPCPAPCFLAGVGSLQLEMSCRALPFVCILVGEGTMDCIRACWRPRSTSMSSSGSSSCASAGGAGRKGAGKGRLACFLADTARVAACSGLKRVLLEDTLLTGCVKGVLATMACQGSSQ